MRSFLLQVLLLLSMFSVGTGQEARPLAEDPELEKRVLRLSHELRCLVCQNETLAESRADLAVDLRNQVREQMRAGKSDEEIVAYLTSRYGDFVLYRPPFKPQTYLLWLGPFLFLLMGFSFLYWLQRQRRDGPADKPLTESERRKAQDLLELESNKPPRETA